MGLFNFLGVGVLTVLCVLQWRSNRTLNLANIDLDKTTHAQAQRIDDQDRTIKGDLEDLDDFRKRLELSDAALKEAEAKVAALTIERNRLTIERNRAVAERDQARAALEPWRAAVAQRDEVIRKANDEIKKLADDRNDAVARINDLAGKYNALVKDLNDARAKLASNR